MTNIGKPHFVIKNKFQKGGKYSDILTPDILKDVCERVTGCTEYTREFDNTGYNKGRLATIEYQEMMNFVSFSDPSVRGRNSSLQSFTTALVRYHQEENTDKRIFFYFLPTSRNYETHYFIFMYRLMKTSGVGFLNEDEFLTNPVYPFTTIEDIIANRNENGSRNSSNNPTYVTRSYDNTVQIYGKTYGANKKETTLLCIAISSIATARVELYQICEQSLSTLPGPDLEVIRDLGKIKIITSDLIMERREFEENDSLRSSMYIYNLFTKLGDKKCTFCKCEIPQLIQGAHIWSVVDIKKEHSLTQEEKLEHAIDGDNGLWLCQNHHKMLDAHLLRITEDGQLKFKSNLREKSVRYIKDITLISQLPEGVVTLKFVEYLGKRNNLFEESSYNLIHSTAI